MNLGENCELPPGAVEFFRECQEGHLDREEYLVDAIQRHLLFPQQEKWLQEQHLSIADLLNGRYDVGFEQVIIGGFYKPWNDILEANGLQRTFTEDAMFGAMMEQIGDVFGSMGCDGIQFDDGPVIPFTKKDND